MKRILAVLLLFASIFCISGCTFDPPEGWTKNHHSHKDVLEYAKSLDPDATVAKRSTDSLDEYYEEYREWDAVINGVECHVASVSDTVWNSTFFAGEFGKTFYRIDTDHDYIVFMKILSENYPNWSHETDISVRYRRYDKFFPKYILPEYRMLNDDELEEIWQEALKMKTEFEKLAINRTVTFSIASPGKRLNHHGEMDYYVDKSSVTYLKDFSEEGKQAFLQDYHEAWALLESGLPIYD